MKSIPLHTLGFLVIAAVAQSARGDDDDPPTDLRSGLESYWPMDGTMDDWLTGSAGVVTGGAEVEFGMGLDEGALIAEVEVGSVALTHGITPGGGALSGSFWFSAAGLGGTGQVMLQDGAAWSLHRSADTEALAISAAGATLVLPGEWDDGDWHHIAFTVRSGGSLIVRVDGAPGGVTSAGTLLPGSGVIRVGADPAHPAVSVGMCLEDVALWTRELAAAELEFLDAPLGGNSTSVLGPAPANYVPAELTVVHDPAHAAVLTWPVSPGMFDNYGIETSDDLSHWSVLGTAATSFSDVIPATPGARRFYRVYRIVEP